MRQKQVLGSVLGLLLAAPAYAVDEKNHDEKSTQEIKASETKKTERSWSVRFGAGVRAVDIEKLLEAYARVNDDITVQDIMGEGGTEAIPYLVLEGAWRPKSWLELSLELDGTGQYLFAEKEGSGIVLPIEYEGNVIGYAEASWTESLKGYYKLSTNALYTKQLVKKGFFAWDAHVGFGVGLGMLRNETTFSLVAMDNPLIDLFGGRENIEQQFGIPTELYKSISATGWSTSIDPKGGSTMLFGPGELRLQCGYAFERAQGRAREFTRYGMTDLWHESKELEMTAPLTGFHAELLVGYRL